MKYKLVGGKHTRENGERVRRGDIFEPTEKELESIPEKLEPVEEEVNDDMGETSPGGLSTADLKDRITHTGGGWYDLPNGERVRGQDSAVQRLKQLIQAGEV